MNARPTSFYSLQWSNLGGKVSKRDVKAIAKRLGIRIRFDSSFYVGHFGVELFTRDKRKLARFEREVF